MIRDIDRFGIGAAYAATQPNKASENWGILSIPVREEPFWQGVSAQLQINRGSDPQQVISMLADSRPLTSKLTSVQIKGALYGQDTLKRIGKQR